MSRRNGTYRNVCRITIHTYNLKHSLTRRPSLAVSNIPSSFTFPFFPFPYPKISPRKRTDANPLKANLGNATPNLGNPDTWPLGRCRRRHAQDCETSLFQQWQYFMEKGAQLVNVTAGVPPHSHRTSKMGFKSIRGMFHAILGGRFPLLLQSCQKSLRSKRNTCLICHSLASPPPRLIKIYRFN